MIKRIVKMTFEPDADAAFLDIFHSSAPGIRAFPGCLHLELLRADRPDNVFFTFSFWTGEEALHAYRHSDLFATTWAKTKQLFSDRPQAWTVHMEAML